MNSDVLVPTSVGELFDKITILEIKAERLTDPAKLVNVNRELKLLQSIVLGLKPIDKDRLLALLPRLKHVNEQIWDAEDNLREFERQARFEADFVAIARSTYRLNDERCAVKRELNIMTSSTVIEEKSYAAY